MNERAPAYPTQEFKKQVWLIARQIPAGQVASYGQIAACISPPAGMDPNFFHAFKARWAGSAMADCPPDVPWQRVINSQGKISPRPGAEHQRQLLEAEGIVFDDKERVDLKRYGWAGPSPTWLAANGFPNRS
jgi:methylated-DNA-protein-cysteine methyltransferase related protein